MSTIYLSSNSTLVHPFLHQFNKYPFYIDNCVNDLGIRSDKQNLTIHNNVLEQISTWLTLHSQCFGQYKSTCTLRLYACINLCDHHWNVLTYSEQWE